MEISIEHLEVSKSNFHDNAAVIRNQTYNAAAPDDNAQILRELQSVRERLNETSDVAKAVDELTEAVKAKDKPAIDKLLTQFAGGTMKAVITAIASKTLLSWMGIS
ncbi:MAG: hypothetical protein IJQ81_14405 [Oscillibacter sp.]|nr:hypothetical protein [Oscillibacter sp.]